MGTYNLPRNVKGEGRILFVFSTKALIYTFVGIVIGLPFYFIINAFGMTLIGLIIMAIFGLIGFSVATFKIPNSSAFQFTKSVGGENIDEVIKRYVKFKLAKNRIYIHKESEKEDESNNKETKED